MLSRTIRRSIASPLRRNVFTPAAARPALTPRPALRARREETPVTRLHRGPGDDPGEGWEVDEWPFPDEDPPDPL